MSAHLFDMTADELRGLDATALPSGKRSWMLQRGLSGSLMDWCFPRDDHDPITADQWGTVLGILERTPVTDPPPILVLATEDDERCVLNNVATEAEKRQAVLTALVTAVRLHDALVDEMLTARAMLAELQASDAG